MKFAIIAAGEGSRLIQEGIDVPKPLVTVNKEMLIDRLLRIFMENGAEEIAVICNDLTQKVLNHLEDLLKNGLNGKEIPLRLKVKSTPSSMHSFLEISPWLKTSSFCLTTVDTIFREDEFSRYIKAFKKAIEIDHLDGLMGVTDFIDDESPLYVATNKEMMITGFLDREESCKYISAGIYGLTPKTIETLERCAQRGESRMRNFQRALVREGTILKAWPFGKVLDIDHAKDIKKAEEFLFEMP
ncbi:MAG: NDP-sugar synthase [Prevotella sp.]|nr:NDP-sugar synthase [Prevotella sp.]